MVVLNLWNRHSNKKNALLNPNARTGVAMYVKTIDIPVEGILLKGDLALPDQSKGIIIFSHGSGSSRLSPRNRFVAGTLQKKGFATLLFDLLTPEEDTEYERRFDISLLSHRLHRVTQWVMNYSPAGSLSIGYFGASTGAASALEAAASFGPDVIKAVVSRGGRPDLAAEALPLVKSPTLLLVGGKDATVITLNQSASEKLTCTKKLIVIPGASHLFEERGKLEEVTRYASEWFLKYLYWDRINIIKDFME